MLLILITALIGFYAKRFYIVPVFAMASHVMLGILYSFNPIGGNDQYIGVVISALVSLVIGSVLYGWMLWYKSKHDLDDIKRIKRRVTKILGSLILVAALLNIWVIYQGIESGKRLVEDARLKVVANTQNEKVQEVQLVDIKGEMNVSVQDPTSNSQSVSNSSIPYKRGDRYENGEVFLYREPVEIYRNDWTGIRVSKDRVRISGQGKTVDFKGFLSLNCRGASGYSWITASNKLGQGNITTDAQISKIVPAQVTLAASEEFCQDK